MFRNLIVLFLCCIILFPISSFAWMDKGHVVIAEIAYKSLSNDTRKKLDRLVNPIFDEVISDELRTELINQYGQNNVLKVSKFAVLNTLPDIFRDLTIKEFFEKFGVRLPKNMEEYANEKGEMLHYIHGGFPKGVCKMSIPVPNVHWALTELKKSIIELMYIKSTNLNRDRAVEIILISHFIVDAHLPIHTLGKVNENCEYDNNGNKFCIKREKDGSCQKKNRLHSVFDTIYFNDGTDIKKTSDEILKKQGASSFRKSDMCNLSPQAWIDENYLYAPFIYDIKDDEGLSVSYVNQAKEMEESRAAIAGYRLAMMIEEIFGNKKCPWSLLDFWRAMKDYLKKM